KKREEEKKAIKKTLKEEEETNNEIDKLLEEVEIIKNKMALGILKNTETNTSYTIQDILDKYQEAIDLASKDNKNIGKELSIRLKKRDEEIAFVDEQNQKSIKIIKDRIDNLKIINEIGSENFNENKDLIIASYNEMIALAEKQGKTELEINQIISERNQYQDTFVQQQKEINGKLIELKNSLLEAQGKKDIIIQRRREEELNAVNELLKNATDEQKANAISMTNALFDIEEAKARLEILNTEIDNLIDKRD